MSILFFQDGRPEWGFVRDHQIIFFEKQYQKYEDKIMEKINLLSECILCCTREGASKQDYDDIIRPSINQVVKEMKSKVKAKSSRFSIDGNRNTLKVLGLEPKGNIEHIAATLSLKKVVAIMLQEKEFALVIKNNQMKKNNYTESLASEIDWDNGTSTLYVSLIACLDAAVIAHDRRSRKVICHTAGGCRILEANELIDSISRFVMGYITKGKDDKIGIKTGGKEFLEELARLSKRPEKVCTLEIHGRKYAFFVRVIKITLDGSGQRYII